MFQVYFSLLSILEILVLGADWLEINFVQKRLKIFKSYLKQAFSNQIILETRSFPGIRVSLLFERVKYKSLFLA